jgi:dihydrofolate synthase/folylpolyglutamate synthase
MNYQESLAYLVEQLPMYQRIGHLAYRTGLDNTHKLDEHFKSPHRHFPAIHVAGTNGKGSVSHILASVFQEAGYRVGLYTSPHLLDFRERIKVNGKLITPRYVTNFVQQNHAFFGTFHPSFFEISVFLAFNYFLHCQVDIAIIEVGLGGRLDATNIINPVLSVITNIGKDHTEILGDTLAKIAGEKAGIIKQGIPAIVGESHPETLPVFTHAAHERNASLTVADRQYQIGTSYLSTDGYQVFNAANNGKTVYPDLKCALLGHYQRKNTVTVLAAIDHIRKAGYPLADKAIYAGFRNVIKNTGLAGRWQITEQNPTLICDTAHNSDGLKQVFQQAAETPHYKLHVILGFVNDKDTDTIFAFLPVDARYYFTRLSVPRTLDEKELVARANACGLRGPSFPGIAQALASLKENAGRNDLAIITGSTFLVADYLKLRNDTGSMC